jgi:hypothetical protein
MAATLAAGGLAAALGWLLLMADGRVLDTAAALLP